MDRQFEFKIVIQGYGDNADEAWRDAVDGFTLDPGCTPDEYIERDEGDISC